MSTVPVYDPDPYADELRAPGTDDEPWTVPEPDPPANRAIDIWFALAVLIIALAVVAIVWWPRP